MKDHLEKFVENWTTTQGFLSFMAKPKDQPPSPGKEQELLVQVVNISKTELVQCVAQPAGKRAQTDELSYSIGTNVAYMTWHMKGKQENKKIRQISTYLLQHHCSRLARFMGPEGETVQIRHLAGGALSMRPPSGCEVSMEFTFTRSLSGGILKHIQVK
ncbi:uncharacterized protein ACIQIH_005408 [Cyanocitta cristata]